MNKYIYVIQALTDENGELYPNYVYKNTDKGRIYFSESLIELEPSEYHKYGISQFKGAGKIQHGGAGDEVKNESVRCEFTPWIMLKNVLNNVVIQNFGELKINQDIITPFLDDVIIKYGKTYYNFDKTIGEHINTMLKEGVIFNGEILSKRYQFQKNSIVYCINEYCCRPAKIDSVGKQRQECEKCTAYRTKGGDQPDGFKIKFDATGSTPLLPNKKITNILIEPIKVDISYTRLCFNNYIKSYWSDLPLRNDGCKFTDSEVKVVDQLNNNPLTEFTYIVPKPKEEKQPKKGAIIAKPKKPPFPPLPLLPVGSIQPIHLLDSFTRYTCELSHDYKTYQSDIYQLDHKDGDHFNNVITNIMVLCTNCHAIKTNLQNDKGTGSEGTQVKTEILGIVDDAPKLNSEIQKFILDRKNYIKASYYGDDSKKLEFADLYDGFTYQETESSLAEKKRIKATENKKQKEIEKKIEADKANHKFFYPNYEQIYNNVLAMNDLVKLKEFIKKNKSKSINSINARTLDTIKLAVRNVLISKDLEKSAQSAAAQP
jgi:5-methylcytosine-specific restriction endonuclease McrA